MTATASRRGRRRALVRVAVTPARGGTPVPAELGDALDAVRSAGRLFTGDATLPLAMVTGQVRDTAVDLLRAVDAGDDETIPDRVDAAAAGH
ncbi:hypothetical protein [Micromonospora aurantiaca (nom. illeg.)]|uniref:hypothetical protein n=1 Tax=Micromonospora aurantiaca (nom. illeg.) TaxID=47850 RepID=UPI003F4A4F8C